MFLLSILSNYSSNSQEIHCKPILQVNSSLSLPSSEVFRFHLLTLTYENESKLAYVSVKVTSLIQDGFKQRTNLRNYEKLNCPPFFLYTRQTTLAQITGRQPGDGAGWGWGGLVRKNYAPGLCNRSQHFQQFNDGS